MGNRAYKGRRFEIWLAAQLSLWWSDGERDDIFYHTHDSGGRATRRTRKGKSTRGLYGDICAVDPVGQPLLDLVTIEAKKGYSRWSIADLLDKPDWAAPQIYEQWIAQAVTSHEQAGSYSWLLMIRRDKRIPLVIMPKWLETDLYDAGCDFHPPLAWLTFFWQERCMDIVCLTLVEFFDSVKPRHICQLIKEV